jgi:NADH-quinone oxidoreductase subunit C
MNVEDLKEVITAKFDKLKVRPSCDHLSFNCPVTELVPTAIRFKDELQFDMLVDVTAVDWNKDTPRFSTVYHFLSTKTHQYIRLVVDCANDEEPEVPSLTSVFPAADWHERETYDMFGIKFSNHPNLKRILMWEGYPYYPLRKEFPLAGEPTELPAPDVAEVTGQSVKAAPMMGGPFFSSAGPHGSHSEPRAADQSWSEINEKPIK